MQTSAMRSMSALDSAGYLNSHDLHFWNVFEPPPSIMYEKSVQGAPQKPIRGTSPASAVRVRAIAA